VEENIRAHHIHTLRRPIPLGDSISGVYRDFSLQRSGSGFGFLGIASNACHRNGLGRLYLGLLSLFEEAHRIVAHPPTFITCRGTPAQITQ
jgi:hypothetical protein